MASPNGLSPDEKEAKVVAYLSNIRFHRKTTLPATSSHGPLRVTYAVVGAGADEDPIDPSKSAGIPTIIWAGAMFGTRWQAVFVHNLATNMGVRVIYIDRPGFGGAESVKLTQRLPVWQETITHILGLLSVKHVVLASHSAGTIYQMNTLYQYRDMLSPTKPYIAFFGPWVHPKCSGVALLTVAKMLPSFLVSKFDKVQLFINQNIGPAFGASAGAISAVASLFTPSSNRDLPPTEEALEEERKKEESYGMDKEEMVVMERVGWKAVLSGETRGVNEEALLCLKKSGDGTKGKAAGWGPAEDYEVFVKELAERERQRVKEQSQQESVGNSKEAPAKLKIDVFFGESDFMIGKKGEKYFRNVWSREEYKDVLDYEGYVVEGSNHDSCCEAWRGGLEKVFEQAKKSLDA